MARFHSNQRRIQVLTCPQCGAQIPAGSTQCAYCGAQLVLDGAAGERSASKPCKYCGKQIPEDAVVCTFCGRQVAPLQGQTAARPTATTINNHYVVRQTVNINAIRPDLFRDKWTAFFLCLFLGIFGAHKFYEKKYLLGVLYFFTLGLFCIGVVVDLVILFFKPRHYIP